MLKLPILALSLNCALGILVASPQGDPAKADNTRENKKNRSGGSPTAEQQKETKADRELAQKIRKSIVDDKSLSTYAHNVKIIVQDGTVTLKGPVRTEQEKTAVEAKARQIAGSAAVHDEVTIAPGK